ncbi:hypothetical protein ABIA39_006982 [Nocardia sp. GAS34]|uniref:hypothetical protein n=1 Tax=unclassified Nocardia TaxID=2637762 RepID=UPI003D240629
MLWIVLLGLGDVEDVHLPAHDDLAAVGDVEEDLVEPGSGSRLGRSGSHRGTLGCGERLRYLSDLVGSAVDHRRFGFQVDLLPIVQASDDRRQSFIRQLHTSRPQRAQAPNETIREQQRKQERAGGEDCHSRPRRDRPVQCPMSGVGGQPNGVSSMCLEHGHEFRAHVLLGCPQVFDGDRQGSPFRQLVFGVDCAAPLGTCGQVSDSSLFVVGY